MIVVWRLFAANILLGFLIFLGVAVLALMVGVLTAVAEDTAPIAAIGMLLAFALAFVVGGCLFVLMWPVSFVICDGKTGVFDSIRLAFNISMANKMTSFLLILSYMVLGMIGQMLLYVGQLATGPLSVLLMAVAYLLMTNQPISDPRSRTFPQ